MLKRTPNCSFHFLSSFPLYPDNATYPLYTPAHNPILFFGAEAGTSTDLCSSRRRATCAVATLFPGGGGGIWAVLRLRGKGCGWKRLIFELCVRVGMYQQQSPFCQHVFLGANTTASFPWDTVEVPFSSIPYKPRVGQRSSIWSLGSWSFRASLEFPILTSPENNLATSSKARNPL